MNEPCPHSSYEGRTNYELLRKDLAELSGMDHAAMTWDEHITRIKAIVKAARMVFAEVENKKGGPEKKECVSVVYIYDTLAKAFVK